MNILFLYTRNIHAGHFLSVIFATPVVASRQRDCLENKSEGY